MYPYSPTRGLCVKRMLSTISEMSVLRTPVDVHPTKVHTLQRITQRVTTLQVDSKEQQGCESPVPNL